MGLILFGVSHKTASAEMRERLSLSADDATSFMEELRRKSFIDEVVVLSTCNRIEVYGHTEKEDPKDSFDAIVCSLSRFAKLPKEDVWAHSYTFDGAEVARHLFTVVSSLDSMVLGEQQILGQVRSAYRQATSCGSTGVMTNRLFHQAMRLGKEVRSKTSLGKQHLSVAAVALDQAKHIFGALKGKTVMVVGAGEMAQLSLRYLVSEGVSNVVVANRTLSHAQSLAEGAECKVIDLPALADELQEVDIVICSTSSSQCIITPDMLEGMNDARKERPLLLLDIAIPRDVDTHCRDFDFVQVLDMDDLSRFSEENKRKRAESTDDALSLIDESMKDFAIWAKEAEVVPAIKALRFFADDVVEGELSKLFKSLHGLDEEEKATITAAVNAVANKLLHRPLKNMHGGSDVYESLQMAHIMLELFDLKTTENSVLADPSIPLE